MFAHVAALFFTSRSNTIMAFTRETAAKCLAQLHQLCEGELEQPLTYFHSSTRPLVKLDEAALLIMESLSRCGLNEAMLVWAAVLVMRYEEHAERRVDAFMVHRLYLAALWVVMKLHSDVPPRAKVFAHMCGMQLWEIPRLEMALLTALHFTTFVSSAELEQATTSLSSRQFVDIRTG